MRLYSVILLAACAAFAVGRPECDRPCPFNLEPVCASDGVTYNNKCLMDIALCKNPELKVLFGGPCRRENQETFEMFQSRPVPMHFKDMREKPEPTLFEHKPIPMHPKDMMRPVPTLIKDAVHAQTKPKPMHFRDMIPIHEPVPVLFGVESLKHMHVHPMDLLNSDIVVSASYVPPSTENEVTEEVHRPIPMHPMDMDMPEPTLIEHMPVPMHPMDMDMPEPTLIEHMPVPMHPMDMSPDMPEPTLIEHMPVPMHPKDMSPDMPEPTLIEHMPVPMHPMDMSPDMPEPTLIEQMPVPMHPKDMWEMPEPTLIEHKPVPMHFKDMREMPEPTLIEHKPVPMHFKDMVEMPIPVHPMDLHHVDTALYVDPPTENEVVEEVHRPEPTLIEHKPVPMHFRDMRPIEKPIPTLYSAIPQQDMPIPVHPMDLHHIDTALYVDPPTENEVIAAVHRPEPTLIEHEPVLMHFKDMRDMPIPVHPMDLHHVDTALYVDPPTENEVVSAVHRPEPTIIEDKPVPMHFRDMVEMPIPVHPMDLHHVDTALYVDPPTENEVVAAVHRPEPTLIEHKPVPMHFKDMREMPEPTLIEHKPVPMHFRDMNQFVHPEPTLIQHMPVPMHPKDMWDMPEPTLIEHKPVPMHFKDMREMPEPTLIEHKPVPMHFKDMVEMPEPTLIEHKPVPMHPKDMVEAPEPTLIEHEPVFMHFMDMIPEPIPELYSLNDEAGCPMACPMNYDPICGSDGVTYSNSCGMEAAACLQKSSVTVAHKGEC